MTMVPALQRMNCLIYLIASGARKNPAHAAGVVRGLAWPLQSNWSKHKMEQSKHAIERKAACKCRLNYRNKFFYAQAAVRGGDLWITLRRDGARSEGREQFKTDSASQILPNSTLFYIDIR